MLVPVPQRWQQTAFDFARPGRAFGASAYARNAFSALHHLTVHGGGATAFAKTPGGVTGSRSWIGFGNTTCWVPRRMKYEHKRRPPPPFFFAGAYPGYSPVGYRHHAGTKQPVRTSLDHAQDTSFSGHQVRHGVHQKAACGCCYAKQGCVGKSPRKSWPKPRRRSVLSMWQTMRSCIKRCARVSGR